MSAAELHIYLNELRAERALAAIDGLTSNCAYMADLREEMAATREAYVCAAVTEIATFRSQLSRP
jgi:hypothetical protein